MFLDGFVLLAQFGSFRIGSQAGVGAERFLVIVPVLACGEKVPKLETRQKKKEEERKKERKAEEQYHTILFHTLDGRWGGRCNR